MCEHAESQQGTVIMIGMNIRELIEFGAVFLAAGLVHLLVTVAGEHAYGAVLLVGTGVVTVSCMAALRWFRARRQVAAFRAVEGNLWLVRAMIDDRPGRLAVLAGAIGALGCNIRSLQVFPCPGAVIDELLVEVPPGVAGDTLAYAVLSAGGRDVKVSSAAGELTGSPR